MIIFAVVTKIPPPGDRGNLATAVGNVFLYPQVKGDHSFPDTLPALGAALGQPMLDLYVQTPVFRLGEILVLGGDGRDQFGRKPDKWSVEVELFTDADEAANRAREVSSPRED